MVSHPKIDTTTLDYISTLGDNQADLSRALGRGQPALRAGDNVLALDAQSGTPLLSAQGHGVALGMQDNQLRVVDETNTSLRDIRVSTIASDSYYTEDCLRVYGEIGDPGQEWHAYITSHGTHIGQVNGDSYGTHFGEIGRNGGPYFTHWGDTHGNTWGFHTGDTSGTSNGRHNGDNYGTNFGDLRGNSFGVHNGDVYGNVFPPCSRTVKENIRDITDPLGIVDAVPSSRFNYRGSIDPGHDHAGPMVEDILRHAPWLVRTRPESEDQVASDRDLIGVLWAACRELSKRVAQLEHGQGHGVT